MWLERQRAPIDADIHYAGGVGIDVQRNMIVHEFLRTDCTHLWFIDDDNVPPTSLDYLTYLESSTYQVLCLPYAGYVAGKGKVWHVYGAGRNGGWISLYRRNWPADPVFHVSAAGTGCMIIAREVLKNGRTDPFYYTHMPNGARIGEDLNFCRDVGGAWVVRDRICRHFRDMDISSLPEPGP